MDLFHTITQEIESVLSCHWLTEFRETHRSDRNTPSATPSTTTSRSASVAPIPLRRSSSSNSLGSLSTKSSSNETTTTKMSDQLMDTERGGEQTQYESIQTVTKPQDKDAGQLGDDVSGSTTEKSGVSSERAEQTAENIRYGQNISESGVGGFTGTTEGTANQEGGYGGTKAQEALEQNVSGNASGRTEQGYSAKDGTHDYKVGG